MIKPDQIPDEVVEAAARAVYETWCKVHGVEDTSMPWGDIDDEERDACFAEAIAALRAGLAAWPGMWHIRAVDFEGKVILPLPQETRDE